MNENENMEKKMQNDEDSPGETISHLGETATGVMDKEKLIMHLKDHITYPATSDELIESCNQMSDVPASDKKWFSENLPEDTYESAEDVISALNMQEKM
ncbi:MAG: hypothetical protein HYV68_00035 [Candidatus Taylorbacteria bacterium]|nr:hypothetical protein [Candidatus Taylorbacteria bacterium]